LSIVCLALSPSLLQAQDLSRYRGFQLGMTVAAVAQQGQLAPGAVRLVHQRPQLIQELDWLPQLLQQPGPAESEAARVVHFTFYDGRLYRIAVEYDRSRVEGLTAEDFVQAISTSYGLPILASTQVGRARPPAEVDLSLAGDRTIRAQWEDAQYSVSLVQTRYPSTFELLLVARQPDQLAQAAILASTRLDLLEAPQRETDRRRKQADEDLAKAQKARAANKPVFRF
jgi:hypothetical protein